MPAQTTDSHALLAQLLALDSQIYWLAIITFEEQSSKLKLKYLQLNISYK